MICKSGNGNILQQDWSRELKELNTVFFQIENIPSLISSQYDELSNIEYFTIIHPMNRYLRNFLNHQPHFALLMDLNRQKEKIVSSYRCENAGVDKPNYRLNTPARQVPSVVKQAAVSQQYALIFKKINVERPTKAINSQVVYKINTCQSSLFFYPILLLLNYILTRVRPCTWSVMI